MACDVRLLDRLLDSLGGNVRAIDEIFVGTGRDLGDGLMLFEALKTRLATLAGELSGQAIAEAGTTLAGLAGALQGLRSTLTTETQALRALAGLTEEAEASLVKLLDHMRLIAILARTAKIEAVSVLGGGGDFGDFANEIVTLTGEAQRTIETCARDHQHLGALLRAALDAQTAFEGRYGNALIGLAHKLVGTLAAVSERQGRSTELTGQAALRSGEIAMAAGGAIVALQSGDAIRQRLEHVVAALQLLAAADSAVGIAAAPLVRKLQVAQLDASATTLATDADAIQAALTTLQDDTAALLDMIRALYRGDGEGTASFLSELEGDLAQASDLLGRCDQARMGVDRVTQALAGMLETCRQAVETLAETVSNIVLIGMNAGLRAARLGSGGRSLVVIAQELKLAADQIVTDAGQLTPTFAGMSETASGLMQADRLDAGHFAALDATMCSALAEMRAVAERLDAALDQLMRDGGSFHVVIGQARLGFSNAGAMSDQIAAAGRELGLDAPAGESAADMNDAVAAFVAETIWPRYTMAAERLIHAEIVEAAGLRSSPPGQPAAPAQIAAATENDVDAFLF